MSSAPRFIPLVCPNCSGDLAGRARDLLAFCPACSSAHLIAGDALVDVVCAHVATPPPGDGAAITLPFWVDGERAVPAFLSLRPLSLARAASGLLPRWSVLPGLARPLPLGARLGPTALPPIARLARLSSTADAAAVSLLAVPARRAHARWRLPEAQWESVPDDILEGDDLARRADSEDRNG